METQLQNYAEAIKTKWIPLADSKKLIPEKIIPSFDAE
jgi:hypothetical protein